VGGPAARGLRGGRALTAEGRLYCPRDSELAPFADGLAWLWRLGPRLEEPAPSAVGLGTARDAPELAALCAAGRLAGAVILAPGSGPATGVLPARRAHGGHARFGGASADAAFTLFAGGDAVVRSTLGIHAVRERNVLMLGAGPDVWGRLDAFWALETLARFLAGRLARPLVLLPSVGCLRLDDFPGTAELQLRGAAPSDARQRRRAAAMRRALERSGARLVLAVAARALRGDEEVPLHEVWPAAVAGIAAGVRQGQFDPACHGLVHLEPGAQARGEIDPREFAHLDAEEAGRRIDAAVAWLGEHVGAPRSFVAPAWAYGRGAVPAATARGLPTWLAPEPGPLLRGTLLHETLATGLPGLHRLDYTPLRRLAAIGLPPTVVFHGRLLDDRLARLRATRDLTGAARLAQRPDLPRIIGLDGVRWLGAAELIEAYERHERIEVRGAEVVAPDGPAPRLLTAR
jgi:hypothetical protein